MTFSRYNPSGYTDGQQLPAAYANQIDLNLSRAIDGYAGGSYTPSGLLTIAGSGIAGTVGGGLTVDQSAGGSVTFSGSTSYPSLSSRNLTRAVTGQWVSTVSQDNWEEHGTSGYWETTSVGASGQLLTCRDRIESGATLVSVTFYTKNGAHGASWPPAQRTVYHIYALNLATGAATSLGGPVDSSDQSVYEAVHEFPATPTAHTWLDTDMILLKVTSEYGGNAVVGTRVYGATLTMTFTDLRPI